MSLGIKKGHSCIYHFTAPLSPTHPRFKPSKHYIQTGFVARMCMGQEDVISMWFCGLSLSHPKESTTFYGPMSGAKLTYSALYLYASRWFYAIGCWKQKMALLGDTRMYAYSFTYLSTASPVTIEEILGFVLAANESPAQPCS